MAVESKPEGTPQPPLCFSSSPAKPLAWVAGEPISLGRFRSDVEALQSRLQAPATPTGDILISCSGHYAFGVALLASWLSGRSALLPPNSTVQTLADLRVQATIAFDCDDAWAQQLHSHARTSVPTGTDTTHGHWQPELPDSTRPAVTLYTSGSTGSPKAVSKSLANLLAEAHTLAKLFAWPEGAILAGVPAQHLYGLTFSVMLPWILGRPWVDDMPRYPRDVLAALARNHASTLISVPAHYQALLQHGEPFNKASDAPFCVSAAAPLNDTLAQQWQQQHGSDILEIYGSTETGVVAWRKQRLDPYWQALPSVRLSTQQGLLSVTSPFVSGPVSQRGYITADRVSTPGNGRFELLGRNDAIIKIAGKRVSLTRIEEQIRACPGVSEAAVIAVPADGPVRDLAIWAAVVGDQAYPLPARQLRTQLRSQLRNRLDGIEVPRRMLVVKALPRNASGKLPQQAIAKLFKDHDQRQPNAAVQL